MAIRDRSLGPVYLARVRLARRCVPVHTADVTQMAPPWRLGRAVIVPIWPRLGIAVGVWLKRPPTLEEVPYAKWLDTPVDDISLWRNPDDQEDVTEGPPTPEYRAL